MKAQGVQTTAGQLKGLDAAGRKAGAGMAVAETHAKRSSKSVSLLGTTAKSAGLLVGAAGLAAGAKVMVREFREAQKVGGQTTAVLKSTGNAAKVSVKHIQDLAGAISKKAGIDDEAIQSGENLLLTFTKIRNETGKGNKIFDRTTQVITDMSVALGQPMKSSAIQVGKALQDPIKGITALRRVGVNFNKQQSDQIAKMVESGHQLEAQRTILKELTKEFGGSAAAQATAGDKFKVSLNNLAEAAGAVLVPALDKVERFLTTLMDQMVRGVGVGGALVSTFRTTGNVIGSVVGTIAGLVKGFRDGNAGAVALGIAFAALTAGFITYKAIVITTTAATKAYAAAQMLLNVALTANPIGLVIVGLAALAAALVVAYVKIAAFRNAVNATFSWIKGNWPLILGILTGPIGLAVLAIAKNWGAIKNAFSSGVAAIIGILRGSVSAIAGAGTAMGRALINAFKATLNFPHELAVVMRDLIAKAPGFALGVGQAIVHGIISGIKSAASGIGDAIGKAAKGAIPKLPDLNPFGEGLGASSIVPLKGGGNLMGARRSMAPFAAVGAANGLRVSSGLRRGAITSSGNTSYHSTGEAVDLAGSPAGMMKTFKTLRSKFGSRLAELIYTPGGAGIKNGKPNVYTGKVAADHFDHVHVAYDTGMPGVGDGIGKTNGARKILTGDGVGSEKQWLEDAWVKVAPLFGKSPSKDPLGGLFKHIRFSNSSPFVGVATDPGKGNETAELLWPRWLWQSSKDQKKLGDRPKLQLFIHEMAHRFQSPKQTDAQWLAEGGAEAFARISMDRRFGGAVRSGSDPYNAFVTKVMKDKGVGWVTSGQFGVVGVGQAGHGSVPGHGARSAAAIALGDGPGKLGGQALANLWVKAGGDPKLAGLMARIAMAESGGDPNAHNPSGATGLWQILGAMVKGNLTNPLVNARNAVAKYKAQGLGAWAASRGAWGKYVGHPGIKAGKAAAKGAAAAKVNPFDQAIASADVAVAQAKPGSLVQIGATIAKQKVIGSRIRAVRKALAKKGIRPATRLRLTQELAQLLPQHAQLGTDVMALRHPAASAAADVGSAAVDAGPEGDPNQPLIDAISAATAATTAHTDAVNALQDEINKQNAIAGSTIGIGLREAQRALADMISGELGGYGGAAGRALTAGSGSVVRY